MHIKKAGLCDIKDIMAVEEEAFIKEVFIKKELSGRTFHKILKVARTIADMDGKENIEMKHISEAVELRSIEDRLFSKKNTAYSFK